MSISIEEVRHVARLARLNLDETEIMSFQGELNALLGHFADIEALVTTGIEPSSHVVTLWNAWSDDNVRPSLSRFDALRNAPVSRAGLFVVPMIIEE
jgi:aspartyl-tRNA(Asn)/glutamyl-tRNA(Gln) amidotransferase subunit C